MNVVLELSTLLTSDIKYEFSGRSATLSKNGKKTKLVDLPEGFFFEVSDSQVKVISSKELTKNYQKVFYKKISGTYASLLRGAVIGLNTGYKKTLTVVGSGYRSSFDSSTRVLSVLAGYSHPIKFVIPEDVKIELESNGTIIKLSGHQKQEVTQTAGIIYNSKKRNVYKNTGIYDADRYVRSKEIKKK